MTLESPSRVRSYEEQRKEGEESRQMRRLLFLAERKKVHHRASASEKSRVGRRASLPSHAKGYASCAGGTHRSRDVRAGASLAVGPGCRRASDFLLLAQQLPVLLLPVLHVDQQRDEAVLHLRLETGFKERTGGEFHEKKKVGRREKKKTACSNSVPPSHSPAHRAEPTPGSALRCSAGWPSPPPPASPSVQTQTAGAALTRTEF